MPVCCGSRLTTHSEVSTTVSKAYGRLMLLCGFAATILFAGYIVAAIMALADGPGGIEVPAIVKMIVSVGLCSSLVLGGVGWLVRTGAAETAGRDIQPIVHAEIEHALETAAPAVAAGVVEELVAALDCAAQRAVDSVTARTAAQLREVVAGDLMTDMLNAAIQRAYRAGMVFEAQTSAPPRVAAVVPMTRHDN